MGLEMINVYRKEMGMTIDDLSAKSGVPVNTLKKICAGIATNPTLETIRSIARALGKTLDDFDNQKPTATGDGLSEIDRELVTLLRQLTPEQEQRVMDFVRGLLASR